MPHNHNHHSHDSEKNIGIAFFLNLSFTIIELIGGLYTNSVAIISDSVHDFGDTISLGLSWYFERLSKKGRTDKYTYGYKRFSLIGAIINSVVLIVGSIFILSEAIPRIFEPQNTNAKGMFFLAILGIVINGAAVLRTSKASSINERIISLHLLEDVLGWVAVLVGSILIQITGLTIIDSILSILIAIFVIYNVFKNISEVLPILLQSTPVDINIDYLVSEIKKIESIEDIHDIHIWSLDEEYNIITIHIILKESLSTTEQFEIKKQIRSILEAKNINHSTIEFELPNEKFIYSNKI